MSPYRFVGSKCGNRGEYAMAIKIIATVFLFFVELLLSILLFAPVLFWVVANMASGLVFNYTTLEAIIGTVLYYTVVIIIFGALALLIRNYENLQKIADSLVEKE
jgi:hypothetical protein